MNFVFLLFDQFRAESAGCYGHPVVQTPNLDQLATQGTRFDQCHVQASLCSPSRCSLMTGWYPHVAGHRSLWHLLRAHEPSLLRTLKEAGYRVEMYGKNDVFADEHIPLALDRWGHPQGTARGVPLYGADDPRYWSFRNGPLEGGPAATSDFACVQAGIDFLRDERSRKQPFFLFLPILNPHPPYNAPEPFHSMYNPADLPALRPPASEAGMPAFHRLIRKYRRLDELDDAFFRELQAIYLGMCSYADWLLGELLRALESSGHAEDTTVIVSSDHGDFAGDYGLVEKCHVAYNDVMSRVPLIIRSPGGATGHVVEEPVELMDVMPTVLELARQEAPHLHFARSLVPQLQGAPGDPTRAVFAECGFGSWESHCYEGHDPDDWTWNPNSHYYPQTRQYHEAPQSISRTVMLRTLDWKFIYRPDETSELYNLREDPRETRNLFDAPEVANVRRDLERRMLDWLILTSDAVPLNDDDRGWPRSSIDL